MADTLALRVHSSTLDSFGDSYLHIIADVVQVAEDGSPRNILTSTYSGDTLAPFVGIRASAQADKKRPEDGSTYSYGWRLGMATDNDPVSADVLAAVLATLRKADKRMTTADDRYGRPSTFGAYVARIADALSLPVMFGRASAQGYYPGGDWRLAKPGDAVSTIDDMIARHRAETVR